MSERELRISGRFEGRVHLLPIRVYYEDTDVSGIVYHANYLRYFERGRSEFLRLAGIHHMVMLTGDEPLAWTIRNVTLDYRRPARLDDVLEVHTRFVELSGARMTASQAIRKGGHDLVRARVEAAVITMDGKPRRIPADVRAKMLPYLDEALAD
ncbi:MAG: tol-pal system-associated acyl-CoA thioesterase [Alphaproteobacteria bacterium]|nr:tol-pal system-associated acyl-CoA thioesterase [Alphaproteobacteria bacterium]